MSAEKRVEKRVPHETFHFVVGGLPANVDINKPCWLELKRPNFPHVHPPEAPCNIKCPGWEE